MRLDVAYCGVCGTDLHIAHGAMDARIRSPQVIGHEMSGTVAELGAGVDRIRVGDPVVVRPLDTRGETPADRGIQPHQPEPQVPRHRRARGAAGVVDGAGLHAAPAAGDGSTCGSARSPSRSRSPATTSVAARSRPGETALVIGGGPIGLLIALVARAPSARVAVVEPDAARRGLAAELGLGVLRSGGRRLADARRGGDGGAGADVVFEVSRIGGRNPRRDEARGRARARRRRRDLPGAEAGQRSSTSSGRSSSCAARACTSRRTTRPRSS